MKHEDRLTGPKVKELVPAAHKAAHGMGLRVYWVNDLELCPDDPCALECEGRKFSLAGGTSLNAQPFIWDAQRGRWLSVA